MKHIIRKRKTLKKKTKSKNSKSKHTFNYYDSETNKKITNKKILDYISSLVIPPAWSNVVIAYPNSKNKRLAVGYDDAKRVQSIYSANSIKERENKKINNLIIMANNMPKINRKINRDINKKTKNTKNTKNGISKDKLIALIIKIIMKCNFRVGKDLYKVKYNSTGITTITRRNVKMYPSHVTISFNGKKGVFNQCSIKDRQILNILKRLYKAKNKDIFTYVDSDSNKSITIDERDVNEYLKQFDENITSKNFRTYNANMLYLNKIQRYQQPNTITARKKLSNEVVKDVATHLHHTPAICKKSYLNRDIVDSYINSPQVFNKYFISNKNSNSIQFIKFLKNNK